MNSFFLYLGMFCDNFDDDYNSLTLVMLISAIVLCPQFVNFIIVHVPV